MLDKFIKIISYFTALSLGALVALILYDATVRYLFSGGSLALQELEWHLFDVVILLSIAYTFKQNAHVRVDVFYDKFSPKLQRMINIFSIVLFILPLSFLIIYVGVDFVEMSFVQNEASSNPGGLTHRWIVKSLMPLAFILLSLQALLMLIEEIKLWRAS